MPEVVTDTAEFSDWLATAEPGSVRCYGVENWLATPQRRAPLDLCYAAWDAYAEGRVELARRFHPEGKRELLAQKRKAIIPPRIYEAAPGEAPPHSMVAQRRAAQESAIGTAKAAAILAILRLAGGQMTVRELGLQSSTPVTATRRALTTLRQRGLVECATSGNSDWTTHAYKATRQDYGKFSQPP